MQTLEPPAKNLKAYAELRKKVYETLLLGQQRIEEQKVQTYWQTGKHVSEYIRNTVPEGKERAAYNH